MLYLLRRMFNAAVLFTYLFACVSTPDTGGALFSCRRTIRDMNTRDESGMPFFSSLLLCPALPCSPPVVSLVSFAFSSRSPPLSCCHFFVLKLRFAHFFFFNLLLQPHTVAEQLPHSFIHLLCLRVFFFFVIRIALRQPH
uniref:Trypanosoma vivax n=1 Tax=Trypanosoma vivax (strain Y486) TaxID=1055687 RepID=G0U0R0_TRYVY|nr:hypothetical protein TVY486_0802680 [Trypanosoma vivax Y486]